MRGNCGTKRSHPQTISTTTVNRSKQFTAPQYTVQISRHRHKRHRYRDRPIKREPLSTTPPPFERYKAQRRSARYNKPRRKRAQPVKLYGGDRHSEPRNNRDTQTYTRAFGGLPVARSPSNTSNPRARRVQTILYKRNYRTSIG